MTLLVLSPHRDDAAFSCGVLLHRLAQSSARTVVVNFFTRSAYAPFSQVQAEEAVTRLRCLEDEGFAAMLGPAVQWLDLAMLDAPLRLRIATEAVLGESTAARALASETASVSAALREVLRAHDLQAVDGVFVPSAIGGHVDHRLVRAAAEELFAPATLAYYEDLPYAAVQPTTPELGMAQEPEFSTMSLKAAEAHSIKRAMSSLYPSQIEDSTVDIMARYTGSLGGERFVVGEHVRASLKSLF